MITPAVDRYSMFMATEYSDEVVTYGDSEDEGDISSISIIFIVTGKSSSKCILVQKISRISLVLHRGSLSAC